MSEYNAHSFAEYGFPSLYVCSNCTLKTLSDLNMKKYEKIISAIKEGSPLLKMIQLGLKPEQVKEFIIDSLEPYFDNKDILEQFALDVLTPESVTLIKLESDILFFGIFEECLLDYHLAKSKDSQTCFKSCAQWELQILNSLSKFWSVLHLEIDKKDLENEEFLHECLRNIGDIIEGLTKPYLKVLLHQIEIANGVKTSFEDINSLDLGEIVDELIEKSIYADLFMPPPWKIRLNQWRNIAYHHTARIENDEIVCWYGKAPNFKEIRLSRKELLEVVQTVFKVYKILRLAYTLFFVDNIKEIEGYSSAVKGVRDEAEFLNFASGLASQGFEILVYEKSPDVAKLVIKDVSNFNPDKRRLHASQFLFPFWLLTKSKKMILEYHEKDDIPNLLVSINSSTCEKIYNGELEPSTLAKIMEMIDLKTKKIIPQMKDD